MWVGIIGSGRIGGNAGTQLARAGHRVMFSFSRDQRSLDQLAATVPNATSGSPREAVRFGDAVILAVPWGVVDDALEAAGSLDGQVVIDTTNQFGRDGLETLPDGLPAIEFNERRMPGARLAKAFNTLTANFQRDVAEARIEGEVAMFYAAEDDEPAAAAATLVEGCGFVPARIDSWKAASIIEAPRRAGAVYGEAYRPGDARRIAAAAADDLELARRLAADLRLRS
jgi:8-hydroxy-5-deazaflavin:NADPH oxidoreductase